jgi:hypothetical protein
MRVLGLGGAYPLLCLRVQMPLGLAYSQTSECPFYMSWGLEWAVKGLLIVGLPENYSFLYAGPRARVGFCEAWSRLLFLNLFFLCTLSCGLETPSQQTSHPVTFSQSFSLGHFVCLGRTLCLEGHWGETVV